MDRGLPDHAIQGFGDQVNSRAQLFCAEELLDRESVIAAILLVAVR